MYFSYEHLNFRYEPFPIGLAKPVMDESVYQELVDNYPAIEQFHYIPKLGKKYSLSERFNPRGYHSLIRSQPVWREFHCWIKSDAFVAGVLDALKERDLDLGYELSASPARRTLKLLKDIARGRTTARLARLRARGGPHPQQVGARRQLPATIVGAVVSMLTLSPAVATLPA